MKKIGRVILFFLAISFIYSTQVEAMVDFNHPKNASPIMIFVSFSMPKDSLKGWMDEAKRIHAPVIIRGLIHNSFKETIKKVSELTENNKGGLQLNPILFEQYGIEKVPAVVVSHTDNCLPHQTCQIQYDVVYGDTTLKYALMKIASENDSLNIFATQALYQYRQNK